MMKNFFSVLSLTLLGFISCIIFSFFVNGNDWTDFTVANSLPKYLNSENWNIEASAGFPDGNSSEATIVTYIKNDGTDNNYKFINVYTGQLTKAGWKLERTEMENFISDSDSEGENLYYVKDIGVSHFTVILYKYKWGKYYLNHPNELDSNKQEISVHSSGI